MVDVCGKMMPAIRVRIPAPKQPAAGNEATATAATAQPKPPPQRLATSVQPQKSTATETLADELDDEVQF
jgi:hypothetical protein